MNYIFLDYQWDFFKATHLQAQRHEQLSLQANRVLWDELRHFQMMNNVEDCVDHESEADCHDTTANENAANW